MKNKLLLAAVIIALAGCANRPEDSSQIMNDAGPIPSMSEAEAAIKSQLAATLKDPDSLKQFEMLGDPAYFTWYRGMVRGGRYDAAYLVCFKYNAKNSYGAYTGAKVEGFGLRQVNGVTSVVLDVNWPVASRHC